MILGRRSMKGILLLCQKTLGLVRSSHLRCCITVCEYTGGRNENFGMCIQIKVVSVVTCAIDNEFKKMNLLFWSSLLILFWNIPKCQGVFIWEWVLVTSQISQTISIMKTEDKFLSGSSLSRLQASDKWRRVWVLNTHAITYLKSVVLQQHF